ncbi:hypothetical protein FS837_002257 [Tulasnella sp. UAMH 9824]|nr:hypothetical protein FS837_002257 [Tulasnella sp. UAMH 9824]
MTLSGLWSRKSTPKEKRPEPLPPNHLPETHWTRVKSKLFHRRDHQAAGHPTYLDASMSVETRTDQPKGRLPFQIISPRSSVPAPRRSVAHRLSPDNALSGSQAVDFRSSSQLPQDSSFSNFVSEYESISLAPPRANTFGVTPYTGPGVRAVDREEKAGDNVEARWSEQLSPCELSSPCAPELSNASPRYEGEVPGICLSTASMAQAVRQRLRAQTRRARLIAEDLASPGFSLDDLSILNTVGPAETDGVVVNGAGESAINSAGSVVAAAPTAPDSGLYETSLEAIVRNVASDEQATAQPSQSHESFDAETTNLDPTSRTSRASSSSSHSVFAFDHPLSDPARTFENRASPNPPEEKEFECELDSVESAGGEAPSSAAAPVTTIPSSHSRSYEWVLKAITPCTQPEEEASMDNQPLQHSTASSYSCSPRSRNSQASSSSSESPFEYDYIVSAPPTADRTAAAAFVETQRSPPETEEPRKNDFEGLPNGLVHGSFPLARANDVGLTGSAEAGCMTVGGKRVESAGDEGSPSLPAAPLPPTVVLRFTPCNMVIVVTPPSPSASIRPSESQTYAKGMGVNRATSRPALHHPQRTNSTPKALQGPAIAVKPLPVKNYSRPFRPAADQVVSSAPYLRPSKRTVPKVDASLVERNPDSQNVHIKNERLLSTSRPFGSPRESEDQLTFFDMIALGGRIDNPYQTVDGVGVSSAADEAEPSLRVEPIHPTLLPRKFARVKRSADEPTSHRVQHQARALTSRVTSLVSKWVKAVSKFVRRPERLEEATAFNPSFDPWEEGYVPPRGPSPDEIAPNDALAPVMSSIWNVYVNLDE